MSVRPFSPSESFAFPKPPGQQTPTKSADPFADEHSTHSTHSQPVHWPMYTPPAPEAQNPFADEASIASATTHASDVVPGAVEMVCRPFAPAREDELGVEEGELITVMEAFDDGWAQVKKKVNGATGLIPIDCFRETGDDLPAFLASKRVSSYVEGGAYAA
ncbi:hypothetical protein BV25DRAFT_1801013 [Artomyces pyxidatus]|uniref:Uncharacterized protein n=1 Tax=Artomyces pyxidatus TaxID=48021 RepID=A0ACB8T7W3_9AGAM|nr:hypothetical protein BV25DRAFT_1801013 [Artomyces pyxidatus]